MEDPFNLVRFVRAQEPVIDAVRQELTGGRKRTHWMWFIFPQLAGLGQSSMARRYGIMSLDEATAYLQHPVLGPRLVACTEYVLDVQGRTAHEIFGTPDDLKFRSSVTLFAQVAGADPHIALALERYFEGQPDATTLHVLAFNQ